MDNKFTINLTIADKRYPLKIDRSEEELVRSAAKLVNDWLAEFRNRFKVDEAGFTCRKERRRQNLYIIHRKVGQRAGGILQINVLTI
jgi:hypothetical protein